MTYKERKLLKKKIFDTLLTIVEALDSKRGPNRYILIRKATDNILSLFDEFKRQLDDKK